MFYEKKIRRSTIGVLTTLGTEYYKTRELWGFFVAYVCVKWRPHETMYNESLENLSASSLVVSVSMLLMYHKLPSDQQDARSRSALSDRTCACPLLMVAPTAETPPPSHSGANASSGLHYEPRLLGAAGSMQGRTIKHAIQAVAKPLCMPMTPWVGWLHIYPICPPR